MYRGPDDNGLVVDGPGILATKAFESGALDVCELRYSMLIILLKCRVEVEKDQSLFGQVVMVVEHQIHVLVMVI